jgi:hypothetical protein
MSVAGSREGLLSDARFASSVQLGSRRVDALFALGETDQAKENRDVKGRCMSQTSQPEEAHLLEVLAEGLGARAP